MSSGVRLDDVLQSMSLATDLGLGQPTEHMVRSSRVAVRLGVRLGVPHGRLGALRDVALLTYVGCPVYGNDVARTFGDDIEFRSHVPEVDLAGFPAMVFMLRRAGASGSAVQRLRRVGRLMATGAKDVIAEMADHCAATGELARRLGLDDDVRESIELSYARWDGRGYPPVGGDELPLPARISHVAEAIEVIHRTAGLDSALDVVRERSGSHFDPAVVAAAALDAESLFAGLDAPEEPAEPRRDPLDDDELDRVLSAVGDFCDLRCPFFAGHARGTAELAAAAAAELGLPDATVTLVRRAGWLHDAGRSGVPGAIWDKPASLTSTERERMRMHSYLVERMFSRPEPLRRIGVLAAAHHERMDGSGYHRGLAGALISAPARLLAAADAYHAMLQIRPHRPARDPDDAAEGLRADVTDGRLDAAAVDAVLAAAGQPTSGRRAGGPMGLTAREMEVLSLLAQGLRNKQIARRLQIADKTVGNHVEHVYTKIGASSRAAAALFAMHHGLVGPAAVAKR